MSDASLAKVVSRIRRAIGQRDDSGIIRTVHGCGYAFAAELDGSPGEPPSAIRLQPPAVSSADAGNSLS